MRLSTVAASLVLLSSAISNAASPNLVADSISTTINRISNANSSTQSNFGSQKISLSDSGRYSVFQSDATNLVAGGTNGVTNVYIYDSVAGTTTLLSQASSSVQSNAQSFDPVINGDGTYVAFVSYANNLVAGDTNGYTDVFRVNLSSGAISLVSTDSSGNQGNGPSGEPSISHDGNLVAFTSLATNLVSGGTNGKKQVFVKNMTTGATTLVSQSNSSVQGNDDSYTSKISWDGTVVAYASDATNLVSGDTNSCTDVFSSVLATGATTIVSSNASSVQGNLGSNAPAISQDGTFVVFQSWANNLVPSDTNASKDLFMKNRSTGATTLISQTSGGAQVAGDSLNPSISKNGRFVVFESISPNYVSWDTNGATDVFIRDTSSGLTTPMSALTGNVIGNAKSIQAAISGDGSTLGFTSYATNLVSPDTNNVADIFTRANPLVGEVVNISPIGDVTETGGAQNAFTITRIGDVTSSLTVSYAVGGTAVPGTDYNALSSSVTISAGSSSAIVQVTPINDGDVESAETISLTLSDSSSPAYSAGGASAATIHILSTTVYTVSLSVPANTATKDGLTQGDFRLTRTGGTTYPVTVNVTMSGTATPSKNYVPIISPITIPAGQSYVDIPVTGLQDNIAEGALSIVMTLNSGSGYSLGGTTSGTVTLIDDDIYSVNVQATSPVLNQTTLSTGSFRISRATNGIDTLAINYAVRGTAVNGTDYNALSGTATIASGSQYVDVTVTPISDSTHPGFKSLIVDLLPGLLYTVGPASEATLTVEEDSSLPTVSMTATVATASENGSSPGNIRVTRTGSTTSSLAVNYNIGGTARPGTDYVSVSGSATITTGNSYVDIPITGMEDGMAESTESVILALQSSSSYLIDPANPQAEVDILDDSLGVVQILRNSIISTRSQTAQASVTVSRIGSLASALTVGLSYSGTAVSGTDYTNPGGSIVIPAGAASATFSVTALASSSIVGNKNLTISVASSSSYNIGTATSTQVKIVDSAYDVFSSILGVVPNGDVTSASVSDNGQYVAFASGATNLVSGDNLGLKNIYLVNTVAKTITRVMALGGAEPNGDSRDPKMSSDGRYIVFSSRASNFYADDTNSYEDVFLYDNTLGTVTYVSKGYSVVSQGGDSFNPQISALGDYIVFESYANNLVLNDTNNAKDIFRWTKLTGVVDRVNLKSGGAQFTYDSARPSISQDGNSIAFESVEKISGDIDSYLDILLSNMSALTLVRVSFPAFGTANNGDSTWGKISSDGSTVVYQSDSTSIVAPVTNAVSNIFAYNVSTGQNLIANQLVDGSLANRTSINPTVSSNGDLTLFTSNSKNLGGYFNCTSAPYSRWISQQVVSPVETGFQGNCLASVAEARISNSGQFVASVVATSSGQREIVVSSNPFY